MIIDLHVQGRTNERDPAREGKIGGTGRGVATRVIMGKDESRTLVPRGVQNESPEWERHGPFIAVVTHQLNAPGRLVQMSDPETLKRLVALSEAVREKSLRNVNIVQS